MPAVRRERVDGMSAREEQTPCTPLVHIVENVDPKNYWTRCGRHFLMTGNSWFAKAIKEIPTIKPLESWKAVKAVETGEPTTCLWCVTGRTQ